MAMAAHKGSPSGFLASGIVATLHHWLMGWPLPVANLARTCAASCVLAGLWLFFTPVAPAIAHPHVWVTIKSELLYAPDGSITAIRHAWAFDDMFSTYALQGIEQRRMMRSLAKSWPPSPIPM